MDNSLMFYIYYWYMATTEEGKCSLNLLKVQIFADLLHEVLSRNGLEDVLLGGLLDLSPDNELVEHEVRLLEVEDDIQLAHLM